jgi:serine/threonine-protein kinase
VSFDAHEDDALWGPGSIIGKRYRLVEPIGRGAMGEVWIATQVSKGSRGGDVALKLIDLAARGDRALALTRFQREARAAAQIDSPHVVRILEHGTHGRIAFLAMELLTGESLEERLARVKKLAPEEVLRVVGDIARGVECAHALGIVHRDLKPSNVFLARDERGEDVVKVLDFGLAKLITGDEPSIVTSTGVMVGTPAYMSPEQVLGDPVTARSDLWQLGVIAFECLSGRRPFEGKAPGDIYLRICSEPLPVPSTRVPVPRAFDQWFARAMRRNPRERFPSAQALVEALEASLASGHALITTSPPRRDEEDGMARSIAPKEPLPPFVRDRRASLALIAGPLALVALGTALLIADFGAPSSVDNATEAADSALLHPPSAAGRPPPSAPSPTVEAAKPAPSASASASSSARARPTKKPIAPASRQTSRPSPRPSAPVSTRPEDVDIGF